MMKRFLAVMVMAGLFVSFGCGSKQLLFGTEAEKNRAAKQAGLEYPGNYPVTGDLDIEVITEGASIRLVNRTAYSYQDVQLWLNRQYVLPVDQIEIGAAGRGELALAVGGAIQGATATEFQPNRYELRNFINQYGEPFPVGGLLNPDRTKKIVTAELFDKQENKRFRLIAR